MFGSSVFTYPAAGKLYIASSIIKMSGSTAERKTIEVNGGGQTAYIWNTVLIGSGVEEGIRLWDSTAFIYNTTIYNMAQGIALDNANASATVKNSAVFNNTDDFYNNVGTLDIDYCASDDGDGTNSVTITRSASNYAALVVDAPNGDFHITDTNSELYNMGTNLSSNPDLSFTYDIDGDTRSGTWDIGADEY